MTDNNVVELKPGEGFFITVALAGENSNPYDSNFYGEGSGLVTVDGRVYAVFAAHDKLDYDEQVDSKWVFGLSQEEDVAPRLIALRTNPDQTELRNRLIDMGVYRRARTAAGK